MHLVLLRPHEPCRQQVPVITHVTSIANIRVQERRTIYSGF